MQLRGRYLQLLAVSAAVLAASWGAMLPATTDAMADLVYPGPDARLWGEATAKANIETSVAPQRPTQYQEAQVTAVLVYGAEPTQDLPVVKIAFSNVVTLSAAEDEFHIRPTSNDRMELDQGTRRPGGGYELRWTWQVTPLKSGSLSLELRIQPRVVINGRADDSAQDVNRPVPIDVEVNPVQSAFDDVVAEAEDLEITGADDDLTVGRATRVSAELPLSGPGEAIDADLRLVEADGSGPVDIDAAPPDRSGSTVAGSWLVTAQESGTVDLQLRTVVRADAGGYPLERVIVHDLRSTASPSFFSRLWVQLTLTISVVVAAMGGALGLISKGREAFPAGSRVRSYAGAWWAKRRRSGSDAP